MPLRQDIAPPGWVRAGHKLATADAGESWVIAIAIVLAAAINIGAATTGVSPVLEGQLLDTDDYMRLVRVQLLWDTGAWFSAVIPRIDPPLGLALHWTRPMDILLLTGALVGAPLVGFQTALFGWGAAISPLLHALSFVAIAWAAAPLLPRRWLPLVTIFFLAQPAPLSRFIVGRPDHHGLLILLLVLAIGFGLRMAQDPEKRANALWAGLVGAIATWVSVEFLVPLVATIAALAVCWLFMDRRFARLMADYSAVLCAGLVVALLVERGLADYLVVEIDKVSIVHPAMFAANSVLWWIVAAAEERKLLGESRIRRVAWAGFGGVTILAVLLWLFPQFLADPMASGGDLYLRRHLANVSETQSLMAWAAIFGERWPTAWGKVFLWLGIALPTVPWIAYRWLRGEGAERRMWLYLGLAVLVFVPLAAYQVRWASYAETVLVLPYTHLAVVLATRLEALTTTAVVTVVRPFMFIFMCVWIFVPGTLAAKADGEQKPRKDLRIDCPISAVANTLNDPSGLGARQQKILALIDFGPEILYRTPHAVMSIPNHRYQPGFTASYRIMAAEDFAVARQILHDQSVDLVMICPKSADRWFYEAENGGRTLYQALSEGSVPSFLTPVPLPESVGAIKVFEVRPDA